MKVFSSSPLVIAALASTTWSRPVAARTRHAGGNKQNQEKQKQEERNLHFDDFDLQPVEVDSNVDVDQRSIVSGWPTSGAALAMAQASAGFFEAAADILIEEMRITDVRRNLGGDTDTDDRVPLPRSGALLALENVWGRALNHIELTELYRVMAWAGTTGYDLDNCEFPDDPPPERKERNLGWGHDEPPPAPTTNEAVCYLYGYARHRMEDIKPGLDVCGPACLGAGGGGGDTCDPPCADPVCQQCVEGECILVQSQECL